MSAEVKRAGLILLFVLLTTDLFYMCLHILSYRIPWFPKGPFWMNADGSYPESFQYIKEFWIVLLLAYVATARRLRPLCFWALIFLWLMLDDALQIHEKFGGATVGQYISKFYTLSREDIYHYGQFFYALGAGIILFLVGSLLYFFSSPEVRKISRNVFALLLLLTFFGVVIDIISHITTPIKTILLSHIFSFIEEAGEHIAMSLILFYSFTIALSRASNQSLEPSPPLKLSD